MGKKDQPQDKGKSDDEYAPGALKGELDFYDNVTQPIRDALNAKKEWEEQNKPR